MKELEEYIEITKKYIDPIYAYYKGIDTDIDEDRVKPSNCRWVERSVGLAEMEKEYVMEIVELMDKILDANNSYEETIEEY